MLALMPKRPSAALREIHRELDRRRNLAAVAKGRIVKKSSPPPPTPNAAAAVIQKKSPTPIPRKPAAAAIAKRRDPPIPFAMKVSGVTNGRIQKPPAPILDERAGAAKKNPFLPVSHKPAEAATKKSSAPISRTTPPLVTSSADSEPIQKGTRVRVRTPTGTTPRGVRIFIMLSAVVVSDAEDGYLEVKYNGDFPRDNARVARDQVKKMPSSHQ
ncbi:hypothetical protein QYE76_041020 [Lolium multiflorum]|uniref:Uncharacterized protein n=1 Tax=Lolium multiflorum TaxID=4521 RepID=A0AAD8TE15_LOLMU|nr:hypothetical protein QYE76_041020 [Lolium multiflorum]